MRKPYRTARPNPRLLEPRMVFDAAAAAVVTELATDTAHLVDLAPAVDATESLLTQQSEWLPTAALPTQIAFVDAALLKDGTLAGLAAGVELVALQPQTDGIAQISAALAGRSDISAIYIVSHGGTGRITLGSTELDNATLAAHASEIASWAPHLSADADILLYGCQVGSGGEGLQLMQSLADLTGADIAASTNNTGPASLGGDWVLETATGTIEATAFATPDAIAQLDAMLTVNVSSNSLTGWIAVTTANNQNDAIGDQQTGSGSVSQDIVGDATYRSAYVKYDNGGTANDLSDDWLGFRIRVNNQDNNIPATPRFTGFGFFGVDADGNGSVDFFAGVYNPAGNNGRIGVYDANGAGNTGPSDTGINGTPAFKYDSTTTGYSGLYSMLATGDGSNFSGDADYFISYQIRIADLNANKAVFGLTSDITQTTVLRYIVGTAAQDNAFNQDISGITGAYMSSNLTWTQLGGFTSPIQTNGAVVISASADTAFADERGGTANGSGGSTPTGNLMTNDAGTGISVTRVQAGATIGVSAGTVAANSTSVLNASTVQGTYGTLTLGADGSYSYAVDNSNSTVQALRTSSDTLTDTFSYRITDASAGTADSTLTITIRGANDAPQAVADTGIASERGGTSNGTAGTDATGNVLTNDTDPDVGDTRTVTAVAIGSTSGTVGQALAGSYGSLTLNSDGSYSYAIDNANSAVQALRTTSNTLTETFSYTITDGGGLTSSSTITITLRGANDAPVITSGTSGSVAENVATSTVIYTGTATDVDDGDGKTWSLKSGVGDESLLAINASTGAVTLRSSANYESKSSYTFTIVVTDTGGLTSEQAVTVAVVDVNEAPVANPDNGIANERGGTSNGTIGTDATGNVLTNDTDPDAGDTRTVTAFAIGSTSGTVGQSLAGSYGSLTLNADGTYSYVIDNANATVQALRTSSNTLTETFNYTMADSGGLTSSSTLTITIRGANDAPVITSGSSGSVAENAATSTVVYTAAATDVDIGDSKTWSLKSGVGDESLLAINATTGAVTLRSPANFEAKSSYTFTVVVTDAGGLTAEQAVTVTVTNVNESPVANPDTGIANERGGTDNGTGGTDATGNALTNDTDPDAGDTRTVTAVAIGSTSGTVGQALAGSYGSLTLNSDGSYSYAIDNANATVQALRTSSNTLTETFTYTMTDSGGLTSSSTLTITIRGANDAPVITSGSSGSVPENTATSTVIYTGTATDVDAGDGKTWSLKSGVGDESLLAINASTGAVTLRSSANYESKSSYTFTIVVTDTGGLTSEQAVTVAVLDVNEAPQAVADTGVANERGGTDNGTTGTDATGNVLANDTDPDPSDTLSVSAVRTGGSLAGGTPGAVGQALAGSYGSLTLNSDGSYSYAIDNANATVQALRTSSNTLTEIFTYTMTDSGGPTSSSTLTITIRGANDAPVITSGNSGSVAENAAISTVIYTGTATDVDVGDGKTWSLKPGVGDESLLAINATTGAVTLRAPADYESQSSYSFTIVVTDTAGLTSEQVVTVNVTNVNEAPLAVADSARATERSGTANGTAGSTATGNALANDTDPDSPDSASVTAAAFGSTSGTVGQALAGSYGSLTLNADGSFSYAINETSEAVQALNSGDTLTETFTYTMADAGGLSSSSTITITIDGANDAPVASVVPSVTVAEGLPMSPIVVPAFTDVDNTVLTYTATLPGGGPLPGWLTFDPVTRTFTGTPPAGSLGALTIRVTGTDGSLTDSVDVSLVVSAPLPPQATDDAGSATEAGGVSNGTAGSTASGNLLSNDTGLQIGVSRAQAGSSLGSGATAIGASGSVLGGSHGQLTVHANGSYSYVVSQSDSAVQALNVGQSLTDVFAYEVTDSAGQTSVALLTVTIAGANDAPVAVVLPAMTLTAGSPMPPVALPPFTDVDNTVLTYGASLPGGGSLPSWLSFDPATRTFSGTPPTGSPGTLTIRVTGTDGSLETHADIALVIGDPPPVVMPPLVTPVLPPTAGTVVIAPPAEPAPRAPEPLPITRSTTTVPPVNEALAPTRPAFELSGSPLVTPYELARLQPVAERSTGDLTSDSRGFRIVSMPSNVQELSVFRGVSDQFVERGSNVKFNLPQDAFVHARPDQTVRLFARQADGRPLPSWLQFDAENGSFVGTPPSEFLGEMRISIVARDGAGNEAAAMFRLNVEEQRAGNARSDSFSTSLRDAQPFSPPASPLPELPPDESATLEPAAAAEQG